MNRNYMVIRPETTGNEKYTLRMLGGNTIQGLLPFHEKYVDGNRWYYYDITSRQPLDRVLQHRMIFGNELRTLMADLLQMVRQLERYLLDEGQVCLQPEFIYVDPSSFKSEFCLIPGAHREFSMELCELSQYLLDHVNQRDGDAVVLAFSVFKECRKLNFGMEDIERCLKRTEQFGAEKEQKEYQEIGGEQTVQTKVPISQRELEKSVEPEYRRKESRVESLSKDHSDSLRNTVTRRGILSILIILGMILFPLIFGLIFGLVGIFQRKWILFGIESALLVALGVLQKSEVRNEDDCEENEMNQEPWEIWFREEAEELQDTVIAELNDGRPPMIMKKEEPEIQTMLLYARPIENRGRQLVPVGGGSEIRIGYFPFIIGKNKDLTDYCLDRPGVSRLHIKIEQTEQGYSVTDLNSTNGTYINGVLLEANEVIALKVGDEVMIANERYCFQ